MSPRQAARRAERAVIEIEGSLVLARVLGDNEVFLRSLAGLEKTLTEGAESAVTS